MKFFFSNWSSGPAGIIIIILVYFTSKIYNSAVNHKKKMLIKFDEKEYWCELLSVTNISYKP